jgi:hypothetical protein
MSRCVRESNASDCQETTGDHREDQASQPEQREELRVVLGRTMGLWFQDLRRVLMPYYE